MPSTDLERDQVDDVVIGSACDRACGVERDVRGQRGEDLAGAATGFGRGDPARAAVSGIVADRAMREQGAPGRGQIVDEPRFLPELCTLDLAASAGGSVVSSSSPFTAGAVPPFRSASALLLRMPAV